jgi:hypothetical protein
LWEISCVTFPANLNASVSAVKSRDDHEAIIAAQLARLKTSRRCAEETGLIRIRAFHLRPKAGRFFLRQEVFPPQRFTSKI